MPSTDFTISDVLAFARSKPADERYDFGESALCALGQYARVKLGVSETDAACGYYEGRVPPEVMEAADGGRDGNTFGALATRLEALEPKSAWTRSDAYLNDLELASA